LIVDLINIFKLKEDKMSLSKHAIRAQEAKELASAAALQARQDKETACHQDKVTNSAAMF